MTPRAPLRAAGAFLGLLPVVAAAGCSDVFTEPFDFGKVEVATERRSGEPVPGVGLTLFTGTRILGRGTSGAEGRFVFDFVPEGSMGVSAELPEGYRPLDRSPDRHRQVFIQMEEGEERAVSFTFLKVGPGTITVRVHDPDDEPIAGAALELFSPRGVVAEGETDADGERVFEDVPFGDYGVRVLPRPSYLVPDSGAFRDGIIVEEGIREQIRFVLERCRGVIRVRAVDGGGEPVSDVPLSAYRSTGVAAEARTDADGRHAFRELRCGDYGVRVGFRLGYELVRPRAGFVDGLVLDAGTERTAEFVFARCSGTIEATVVDGDGRPVEGAGLEVYSPDGVEERAVTGADGRHAFGDLPCRPDYGIRVVPPEGFTVEQERGSGFFDGIELGDGDEKGFTFTLSSSS